MKQYFALFIVTFLFSVKLFAQTEIKMPKVPLMRQLFHTNIDQAQQKIILLNPLNDSTFIASGDEKKNIQINRILKVHINNLQAKIELDTALSENDKFIWLRAVETLLRDFVYDYQSRLIKGDKLGDLIINFEAAMKLERKQASIEPIIIATPYEIGSIILQNPVFATNTGYKMSRDNLVLKMCKRQPANSMKILNAYPDVYFADSIIKVVAYKNQEELYNYAASPNELGDAIRKSDDPLVKIISQLAQKNTGRMYFPFLDLLYKNEISIDSVGKLIDSEQAYYKFLVQTEIRYAEQMQHADTPLVYKTLTEKLRAKAIEIYIDDINALHDEKSDAVRFKKIDSLQPTELYYLCVLGEEEIYTSSYLGVYKRIFQRMKVPKADTLLKLVSYDYYKKFIKMAAAYNQLDDFLKRMDTLSADKMMRSFVTDLAAKNTLEDAVDVADSYASITNKKLRKLILEQVQANMLEDTVSHTRAATIYRLLYTIFQSMDTANHIDLTAQLGINPIFIMPNKLLKDTSGRIIIQQFFYGDKDGKTVFEAFLGNFKNPNWKITQKKEWVEVKSVKGVKGTHVCIYANKPLDTEKDLDAQAQEHLINYLDSLGLKPTVVIHRGHSYYVKYTIEQLASSAKIVLLGSCGGYQSLNKVLEICPQAHIISSKQVGTGVINQGMINAITEQLRLGKDLNWPVLWKGLSNQFKDPKSKEKFNDYIPPYKNLGAIFIMAYNIAIGNE
ncbi:hypothetical protein [Parasediminibacterium sp. JCM 36343]|uniref:hypothetical protein n=1 Tax=Parasediminibacterium sp. JCM 36343 TaxID=3374279 RepID=UPI00397C69D2